MFENMEDKMFEEKMILQADKIERLMQRLNWTPRVFADVIKVDITEAYKLLEGEAVNYYTAKAFIEYFKVPFAAAFIDFAAMNMEPPKFCVGRLNGYYVLFGCRYGQKGHQIVQFFGMYSKIGSTA